MNNATFYHPDHVLMCFAFRYAMMILWNMLDSLTWRPNASDEFPKMKLSNKHAWLLNCRLWVSCKHHHECWHFCLRFVLGKVKGQSCYHETSVSAVWAVERWWFCSLAWCAIVPDELNKMMLRSNCVWFTLTGTCEPVALFASDA